MCVLGDACVFLKLRVCWHRGVVVFDQCTESAAFHHLFTAFVWFLFFFFLLVLTAGFFFFYFTAASHRSLPGFVVLWPRMGGAFFLFLR